MSTCQPDAPIIIHNPTCTVTACPSEDGRPVRGSRRTKKNPSSRLSASLAGCWMRTKVTSCCNHSHGPFDRGGGLPRCELSLPSSLDAFVITMARRALPCGRVLSCRARPSHGPGSKRTQRQSDGPSVH